MCFSLQVGLILHALGFDNSTRIYLAMENCWWGSIYEPIFKVCSLENHSSLEHSKEIVENTSELAGSCHNL